MNEADIRSSAKRYIIAQGYTPCMCIDQTPLCAPHQALYESIVASRTSPIDSDVVAAAYFTIRRTDNLDDDEAVASSK